MDRVVELAPVPFDLERTIEYSRALVSALPEATVLVVDDRETVWIAEGKLLERNGFRSGELAGRRLPDILPPSRSVQLTDHYRAALAGEPQSFDYETVDGERLCWIQLTPMYMGDATPRAVISVLQDVTDRHRMLAELRAAERARSESEALFRQGFDGSPIGMAVTDPASGRYLRVNDAFCRLLGRDRDALLGCCFTEITHPDDVDGDEAARAAMVAGELPHFEREKRYLRADGSVVWTSAHMVPLHDGEGSVQGLFSQVVDITARREREERLIREAADLERLEMIRAALAEDRLVLHAQPIFDVLTGIAVQQELLVRLRRRDGTLVPPGEFLPVAERYGSIREIDQWVTQRAVELAAAGEPVEVNLSAASVGDDEMLATIRDALERTGADPSLVVFEVTETALMADLERGRRFATALRELGCRFALDDFGTGYGTFTYLKHIPIDSLKIDVEFVRDLLSSADDERVVRAIVTMAHDFGKTTIAEGVEDAATLVRLRELGVDHAQGYHLGRPAEIDLAVRWAPAPTRTPAALSF